MVTLGQIGVGYWGKNLLRNFVSISDCQVKICCDIDETILRRMNRDYPGLLCTQDYSDVLADDEIQAVVIATLPKTHFILIKRLLIPKQYNL